MQLQVTTIFLRSRRPVLCLLKRPPKARNTGRNARHIFCLSFGVRASIHTLPTNRPISALCLSFFGICWGVPPLKVPGWHPKRLRDNFVTIFDRFGSPFGVPGGALWGSCWRILFETYFSTAHVSVFFSDSEKGVKMELPKGGPCNPSMPGHVS